MEMQDQLFTRDAFLLTECAMLSLMARVVLAWCPRRWGTNKNWKLNLTLIHTRANVPTGQRDEIKKKVSSYLYNQKVLQR